MGGRAKGFDGEWVVRTTGMHRAVGERASALRGRASGLRGGAEVLGKGVSLCRGERKSSAGNGLCGRRECIAHCGRASALRGGAEVLGKGVLLCGGGRRSSAGNGW